MTNFLIIIKQQKALLSQICVHYFEPIDLHSSVLSILYLFLFFYEFLYRCAILLFPWTASCSQPLKTVQMCLKSSLLWLISDLVSLCEILNNTTHILSNRFGSIDHTGLFLFIDFYFIYLNWRVHSNEQEIRATTHHVCTMLIFINLFRIWRHFLSIV